METECRRGKDAGRTEDGPFCVTNGKVFVGPFHKGYISEENFTSWYVFPSRAEADECLAVMGKYVNGLEIVPTSEVLARKAA